MCGGQRTTGRSWFFVRLGGKRLSLLNLLAGPGIFLDLVNLHERILAQKTPLGF